MTHLLNDIIVNLHKTSLTQLVPFSELWHRISYLIIIFLDDPGNQIS